MNSNMKHIDDLACDGISYLTKLTTTVPELSFKEMKKCRFVCGQCCQQIEQLYRFHIKCFTNNNIFIDYVSQLSFFDEISCQLSVCLNDFHNPKHLYCIKDEPVEVNEGQNENVDQCNTIECNAFKFDNPVVEPLNSENLCTPIKHEFGDYKVEIEYDSCFEHTNTLKQEESEPNSSQTAFGHIVTKKASLNCQADANHLENDTGNSEIKTNKDDKCFKTCASNIQLKVNQCSGDLSQLQTLKRLSNLKCDYCPKTFTSPSALKVHLRVHTGDRPYKCDFCSKAFKQSGILNTHMRIHTGDKPFKCEFCPKTFAGSDKLKIHLRIHTGDRPYKCTFCSKTFNESGALNKHLRVHTGERPYKCNYCTKTFSRAGTRTKHLRIHTNDKPYKCNICSKRFIESCALKRHLRIHNSERPFKCEFCFKTFSESDTLKNHLRIHTRDTPFNCNLCSKTFHRSSNLKKHLHIHSGNRPFKCHLCSKTFVQSSNLTRHQQSHTKKNLINVSDNNDIKVI